MQVKATDHPRRRQQVSALTLRVQRRDLLSWSTELYPVILVLYDATADQAFWMHVQGELQGGKLFEMARRGATIALQVPLEQRLDNEAIHAFRQLKALALARW